MCHKISSLIFCVVLSVGFVAKQPALALSTSAEAVILMELESGRVLYAENIHEEMLIASITKLMTALLAMESQVALSEVVTITAESVGVEGSSLYLEEGDTFSLEGLLYGLLLHSGNDAATAIALACGGTVEEFVTLMNEKAEELGMTHSQFQNPHGLNQEGHYSSAYDMALLAQACLSNEALAQIVATKSVQIDGRSFTNKNKLLWNYEGCVGMKTGYTELAGRTLVSAATRDGMTLICVTLNDRNDWVDHSKLFDYGFEQYHMYSVAEELLVEMPLHQGLTPFVEVGLLSELRYPLNKEEELLVQIDWTAHSALAPVAQGQNAGGLLTAYVNEEKVIEKELVYLSSRENILGEEDGFFGKLSKQFGKAFLDFIG